MELQVSEDKMKELRDLIRLATKQIGTTPVKLTFETGSKKVEIDVVLTITQISRTGYLLPFNYIFSLNMIQSPTPNNSIKG